MYDAHVAIFGQNEEEGLHDCLLSVDASLSRCHSSRQRALVTVILNGSTDRSREVVQDMRPRMRHEVHLCTIPHGDKSNAINQFIYTLRKPAQLYICIDAYAAINSGAIPSIINRFSERPLAHIVTGVATNGRTERAANERAVEQGGVMRGQLYAVRPAFLDRLVDRGVMLPIGLYRGDGLIGYFACSDLDPVRNAWDNDRVAGVVGAQFKINQLSPLRAKDCLRHLRRMVQQMRGRIENAAIGEIATQHGFEGLPRYAADMLDAYLATHPMPHVSWTQRPLMAMAVRKHRAMQRPAAEALIATCS